MNDIIIIDNSPSSYLFQPENALPIVSWYDNKQDTLLYEYIPFLKELSDVDDVRPILINSVENNVFNVERGLRIVKEYKE